MSSSINMYGAGPSEAGKSLMVELAVAAMEELVGMAKGEAPLWIRSTDNTVRRLNEDEYSRNFPGGIGPKDMGLKSEASRDSTVIHMSQIKLVEIMMDVNQWSAMFSGIVLQAMTTEVLSAGVAGNYDGALQVMTAEFQIPSPLVPTRKNYFLRYCKQLDNGIWVVADVSLDNLRPPFISRCRRRPSGCLIEKWPGDYSKVTWVEHVEVDDRAVPDIYKPLVNSGLAFGAKRWVKTLERQYKRLESAIANIPAGDEEVIITPHGRKNLVKLTARMALSFYTAVGRASTARRTTSSGTSAIDVLTLTRRNIDDPGSPPGPILSAAASFRIPVPPKKLFDFLRDVNSRSVWDILAPNESVQEMAQIANHDSPGNCVSLLRINNLENTSQSNSFLVQESCSDPTGSYVIYAPLDFVALNVVLRGGHPDCVVLLPSGFAIHPDGPGQNVGGTQEVGSGGSLLTVAFQILVNSEVSESDVSSLTGVIKYTVYRIELALGLDSTFDIRFLHF